MSVVTHEQHPERAIEEPRSDGREPAADRLIPRAETEELRQRWDAIQASFIDEPRQSVQEADHLVEELTGRIVDRFAAERRSLEEQWSQGDEVSTEALRQSLQRYRGFFDRLLHL